MTNKKVISSVLILLFLICIFLFFRGCPRPQLIDEPEAIKFLNSIKQSKPLTDFFKQKGRALDRSFSNSLIECYVDNSYGMQGFVKRLPEDLSKDSGLPALIDKIQLIQSKDLKFRAFDYGKLIPIPKEQYPNFKSLNFYTNTLTPMQKNMEKICNFINKNEIDGAFILTDGIEDMGLKDTNYISYVKTIRDWVKNGNSFQLISVPLLFRGKTWHSPIEGPNLALFYTDYSFRPSTQYFYVLVFSNKTFSNKTLGDQLLPFIQDSFPNCQIEYSDFYNNFIKFDAGFSRENEKEGTFQNSDFKDALNSDLNFRDHLDDQQYWNYRFNKKRKLEIITYDKNDNKKTINLDSEKVSLGIIDGTITVPNMIDINKAKFQINLSYCSCNTGSSGSMSCSAPKTEIKQMFDKLKINEKDNNLIIPIRNLTLIKKSNDNVGFNTYSFDTDNILIKIPNDIDNKSLIIKISVGFPLDLAYNKKITQTSFQTFTGVPAVASVSNNVYLGLKELEIYNTLLKHFLSLPDLDLFSEYVQIDF